MASPVHIRPISLSDASSGMRDTQDSPSLSPAAPSETSISPSATTTSSKYLLPIPTPSTNRSQSSFALSEVADEEALDDLPAEIADADISIAADGSFVETTSGPAARELKRRYDRQYGVSKDVRSPYLITAIINQHGKQVFRIGLRSQTGEPVPPILPESFPLTGTTSSGHSKRRSRMSINGLLTPSVFKNGTATNWQHPLTSPYSPTPPEKRRSPSHGPRKLRRKPRSNPDLYAGAGGSQAESASPPYAGPSGRTHSHSVTGADMPHLPLSALVSVARPNGDVFSGVMGWDAPASPLTSSAPAQSTRSLSLQGDSTPVEFPPQLHPLLSKDVLEHPFGGSVSFDSPSRSSSVFLAPVIREMQSFESNLTAKAAPRAEKDNGDRRRDTVISDNSTSSAGSPAPRSGPSYESKLHTRYSTSVFDVLQTYRGLPMLDTLSAESRGPTIKMSLSIVHTAAPRDDPRFVIWGDVLVGPDDVSLHDGLTDLSSSQSGVSRRKNSRAKSAVLLPELHLSATEGSRRILMAATIERWIAQLTSQLDYNELLNFLLTYRTYIEAVDLCQLLICRFHWALEEATSPDDMMVRRIVRVRTFVAIRYWLLTFFRVDFLPNRKLCLLFANWLNTLRRDPILEKHLDALNIVRKLRKVVKDCKEAHAPRSSKSSQKNKPLQSIDRILGDLSNGVNFAASLRKVAQADDDSDVDLDFNPEESSPFPGSVGIQGFASFANQLGPSAIGGTDPVSNGIKQEGTSSPGRPTASHIMLQQPLHMAILQHARAGPPGANRPLVQSPATLPVHHSALSRVVVNTIGRLGRWKRVLSSRSPSTSLASSADVGAVDLELNAAGDLLAVRGGVEQYLKIIEPPPTPLVELTPVVPRPCELNEKLQMPKANVDEKPTPPSPPPYVDAVSPSVAVAPSSSDDDVAVPTVAIPSDSDTADLEVPLEAELSPERRDSSLTPLPPRPSSSSSSFSLDAPSSRMASVPPGLSQNAWHPDIVSIDDLDLSDTSSNEGVPVPPPPGLKRVPRRLPLRREFEFVRRSVDSVSSMGIISRPSIAMSEKSDSAPSSPTSSSSSRGGLGETLQQWQMNALIDDLSDDDNVPGDAEAALRRLEGQINPQKQQAKEAKVDGWVRTMQERMAKGDFGDDQLRSLSDDEDGSGEDGSDEDYGSNSHSRDLSGDSEDLTASVSQVGSPSSTRSVVPPAATLSPPAAVSKEESITPTNPNTLHRVNGTGPCPVSPPVPASKAKPKIDDAVPAEILQSRIAGPTLAGGPANAGIASLHTPSPNDGSAHRSFILGYRSEALAQHFAVIDREIFLGIKFEELVSEDWMTPSDDLNVLDWGQFLRDRRRKVESRGKGKTSALAAARARFNLVANFTASEIVFSHPSQRVLVVSKFIRIAWKAYTQNNFATLVAVVSGLSSDWVKKVMHRSWNRVGIWEMRVLEDLRAFSTSDDDFRYIRQAIAAITDAKPLNAGAQDDSTTSIGAADGISSASKSRSIPDVQLSSCVPFIGVYLSQLYRFGKLPDLIDPSAPTERVGIDPATGNFKAPAHSEVFMTLRPLPPSMQLEPLINVQKQRLIASVIKSLVAGQHLANKVDVSIDRKLLHRCLKLRAMDFEALQSVTSLYSDY